MAGEPRPGMPQSEKDRLFAETRKREQAEQDRAAGRRTRARWHSDDELDGLDKPGLLAEAELRGVDVKADATKPEIVKALRAVSKEEAS